MKRDAREVFTEEVLWAQIREGVERYEERQGGEKGVTRRKIKLDAKHTIDGHNYLSKVVYIHPTEEVNKDNCSEFAWAIKNLLKEKKVIAQQDTDKFRSKWFGVKAKEKPIVIDGLRLEFDTEGDHAHPKGTVAIYGEAAIDLVNYVNQNIPDRVKKSKHKDRGDEKLMGDSKKAVGSKKKASAEPKKAVESKKKVSAEPKKGAESKQKASVEHKNQEETASAKSKSTLSPQKSHNEVPPAKEKNKEGATNEQLDKHLIPFLRNYYWNSKHPKMPNGELVVPKYKPYNSKDEVHPMPYTLYVTPHQGLNEKQGLAFGEQLLAYVAELLHSMKISKFTMQLKTAPDTNYEVRHANIGLYRAELDQPKYPIGTLMLATGTLARLVNHFRPKFDSVPDEPRYKRNESPPRKSYSEDSEGGNKIVVAPVQNVIESPVPEIVPVLEEVLSEEIAVRVLSGSDNSMNSVLVKSSENQQFKEEQELKQEPKANNVVIDLEDFDLAIISEDDDPEFAEIRKLVKDNSSLASEVNRKSQEFESLEQKVVRTKDLYESEKKALKEEVKAKLPFLRQQSVALAAQVQSLEKRIEERAQAQTVLEEKLFSIKKAKVEKSPEAQPMLRPELNREDLEEQIVTIPTQQPDGVLVGDGVERRDSANVLCQMDQGEESSRFSLSELGVRSPTPGSMFSDWSRTVALTRVATASSFGSDEDKNSKSQTPVVSQVRERALENDAAPEGEGKRLKL